MNRFMAVLLALALPAFAGGIPGAVTGPVLSAEAANVKTLTATVNALCAAPTTGCTTGQWARAKVGGRGSATFTTVNTAFNGTWAAYLSSDEGATWNQTSLLQDRLGGSAGVLQAATNGFAVNDSATHRYTILIPYGGVTDVALLASSFTSGSSAVSGLVSVTQPNVLPFVIVAKGSQGNGSFLGTVNAKDAGRSFVVLGADGVTPAIAETVITFSKNVAGTVTGAQTTYAITSGKTLRLQSLCASYTAGAAANRVRVALRLNTGGACVAGSGLLLPALELAPQYGTAAASEGWAGSCVSVPDGLELTGASWNVCLSETAVAASGTLTVNVIGYEY